MTVPEFYDRRGRLVTKEVWLSLFSSDYQRIARTTVNGWTISTVWLGFDRDGENPDRPLIFETRAFGPEPDEYDNTVNLYATESDAVDGHARAVFAIRDGLSRKVVESSAQ